MSSNIVPIQGRPLTGVYPSCPPPPIVDCMGSLAQCYADVKAAQAFLEQMLIDIINCNPDIIGRGTPIVGVTDGSNAQPGMVGEIITLTGVFPYNATQTQGPLSLGSLPAGDWDCWTYGYPSAWATDFEFALNPVPAGFENNLWGKTTVQTPTVWIVPVVGIQGRASTTQPSLIAFTCTANANGPGDAGTMAITFNARRRR